MQIDARDFRMIWAQKLALQKPEQRWNSQKRGSKEKEARNLHNYTNIFAIFHLQFLKMTRS